MEIEEWQIKLKRIHHISGFYGQPKNIIFDFKSGTNTYCFQSSLSIKLGSESSKVVEFFGYYHDSWHSKVDDYTFFTINETVPNDDKYKIELKEEEKVIKRELYFWKPEFCFGVNFICEKNSYYVGVIPLAGGLELKLNMQNDLENMLFPIIYKDFFKLEF